MKGNSPFPRYVGAPVLALWRSNATRSLAEISWCSPLIGWRLIILRDNNKNDPLCGDESKLGVELK